MTTLTINQGKLTNAKGEIIKPEFGNLEHIKAVRIFEKETEGLTSKGKVLDVDYEITITASTRLKCLCGKIIFIEQEVDEEGDLDFFINEKKQCRHCDRIYVLSIDRVNNELICKLK